MALHAQVSWREIERQSGIPKDTVGRHARHCLGLISPDPKTARNGRRRAQRTLANAVSAAEAAPIESSADVLRERQYLFAEAKALYERAKASSDTRLLDKALAEAGALLDRFARSFGRFGDGTIVTIDRAAFGAVNLALGALDFAGTTTSLLGLARGLATFMLAPAWGFAQSIPVLLNAIRVGIVALALDVSTGGVAAIPG